MPPTDSKHSIWVSPTCKNYQGILILYLDVLSAATAHCFVIVFCLVVVFFACLLLGCCGFFCGVVFCGIFLLIGLYLVKKNLYEILSKE